MPSTVLSPRTPRHSKTEPSGSGAGYFVLPVDHGRQGTVTAGGRISTTNASSSNKGNRPLATAPLQSTQFDSSLDSERFQRHADRREFSLKDAPASRRDGSSGSKNQDPDRQRQNKDHPRRDRTPPSLNVPPQLHKAESVGLGEVSRHSRSPKRMLSADSHSVYGRHNRDGKVSRLTGSPPSQRDNDSSLLSASSTQNSSPSILKADTLPTKLESKGPSLSTVPNIANLIENVEQDLLILDLRATTQYSRAHIRGSLSLCVPTTLLKRPVYTVQKLADTYKDPGRRTKFESWMDRSAIIVYDSNTSHMRDATNLLHVLNKFLKEGYRGSCFIIRGGFSEFSQAFPQFIESDSTSSSSSVSSSSISLAIDDPAEAPVIGGCPMPGPEQNTPAFFSNVRQNVDLVDGVGQFPVKRPAALNKDNEQKLPLWLRNASDEKDKGRLVSEKFLQIEKREQRRMQQALSGEVSYGRAAAGSDGAIQIAGVEKGSKNRYNNIFPYEHSRVKLADVPEDGCDYVNANFAQSSISSKRYIATQGPMPATFSDFWNVIWHGDVRVIVMLTAETEGGQVKAHNYWDQNRYGPFKLHHLSEQRVNLGGSDEAARRERPSLGQHRASFPVTKHSSLSKHNKQVPAMEQQFVTVRKFTLSHEKHPFEYMREITQIHYKDWPDFGTPTQSAHLLGIVELVNVISRNVDKGGNRPLLVHCSAGCGRTGAFCTVDSVIDILRHQRMVQQRLKARHTSPMDVDSEPPNRGSQLGYGSVNPFFAESTSVQEAARDTWQERDDIDLIEKTVEDFRNQRLSMVQTLRQFVLCYETVLEWVVRQWV